MKEITCKFGHECTSGCGNDYDCPCQADHCCELTENCEGCDDHFVPFSAEEVWSMPAEKNEKGWCAVAVVLFAVIVVTLIIIL